MDELCAYMTSTPPASGHGEVVMPGELDFRVQEQRRREGIPLPAETCQQIEAAARQVGVEVRL